MFITIYSKPGCHLCDEAKSVLKRLASEFSFTLREINIEVDPDAFAKYRDEIPVVFLDEVKFSKGRLEEGKLRPALKSRF